MNRIFLAIGIAAVVLCSSAEAKHGGNKAENSASGTPGQFDYYVLSLSWSPQHCQDVKADHSAQCTPGSNLGFVLHGLWPQYNVSWPHNCSTDQLPSDAWDQYPDVFPSQQLMQHEWEIHGTCTGLSYVDYFTLANSIKTSVNIPDTFAPTNQTFTSTPSALVAAFASANPDLVAGSIDVICEGGNKNTSLQEVHICFDKLGKSQACSADETKSAQGRCRSGGFNVLKSN